MKKKLGRPTLPKDQVRSVLIALKVSPDESTRIERAAKAAKQSKPEWMRNQLLSAAD
jgi:uncharacterized protein (DUF1778 family)